MSHRSGAALAVWAVSAGLLAAGELRLKTRTIDTNIDHGQGPGLSSSKGSGRRTSTGRAHWLLSIEGDPPATLEELQRRGASVLSHVPVTGYIVAAPDEMDWRDLDLAYRGLIAAEDKLSPLAAEAHELQLLLVRFHRDVEAWQADGILEAEGLVALNHASLESVDRLLELTPEEIARLLLWDEVEYIFPAPAAMKEGEAFLACGGVHSGNFEVSMLATTYGDGWDGPGRGRADLTYSFGPLSATLNAALVKEEARKALNEWARVVALSFRETGGRQSARNLDLSFASGDHGDPYPFLAGTRTLAHGYYPAAPNPEPTAGDVHVNNAFDWSIGGSWDVYSVLLHELGHALGIGHTDAAGSVMYAYYQNATNLKPDDIGSIRQLYADATTNSPAQLSIAITNPLEASKTTLAQVNFNGSLANGLAGTRVEYRNEMSGSSGACLLNSNYTTWSCAAVPLSAGDNRVAVTALLDEQLAVARRTITRQADADVALAITSPAAVRSSTSLASMSVSGTAQHATGISHVRWTASSGQSGNVTLNGTNWTASIPLDLGVNEITIKATARSGVAASRTTTIHRLTTTTTQPANPAGDRTAPQMTIQTPVGSFIYTSAARITFRGSATDNVGVARVTWKNSAGAQSGEALTSPLSSGLQWSFDVNLLTGYNAIEIKAWDTAGNASGYTATVRRY